MGDHAPIAGIQCSALHIEFFPTAKIFLPRKRSMRGQGHILVPQIGIQLAGSTGLASSASINSSFLGDYPPRLATTAGRKSEADAKEPIRGILVCLLQRSRISIATRASLPRAPRGLREGIAGISISGLHIATVTRRSPGAGRVAS